MIKKQSLFPILVLILMLVSCKTNTNSGVSKTNQDFIYLEGKTFKLKNKDFFPVMINYVVSFRKIGNEYLLSPIREYENPEIFETNTKDSLETQLRAHFKLIKEMGFNSLRIAFDRVGEEDLKYFYGADHQKLYIKKDYNEIFNGLEKLLKILSEFDLKVMLLIKAPVENRDLEEFTIRMLNRFQSNPSIFAYDFFNEPLYFDQIQLPNHLQKRAKVKAFHIVSKWKRMMKEYAPHQLFTIGFSEPIEVFEWDPEILPVDFLSFHTYNPLRVPNEIYWYGKYTTKPWMIGETALPADNDSISYEEQSQFMREVYQGVVDCGGSGLAWWQFQDVPTGGLEAKFTGIIDHKGTTTTKDGKYTILGSVKPAVKEIAKFRDYKAKPPLRMVNYYNMLGYNNIVLCGQIVNSTDGKPIEGAVIRGWNESWGIGMNTFTNEKGCFTLYSNDVCVHFEISAPKMSKIKFDYHTKYYPLTADGCTIQSLPNQSLEYHSISYKSFLLPIIQSDSIPSDFQIFNFDSAKFNQAKLKGFMGIKKLQNLSL
ncbi:MAG: hypothetical protein WCO13_00330 [Bacteroidota bacterium]